MVSIFSFDFTRSILGPSVTLTIELHVIQFAIFAQLALPSSYPLIYLGFYFWGGGGGSIYGGAFMYYLDILLAFEYLISVNY